MPLMINIELTDQDLEHFARAKETATKMAVGKSNAEVVDAATELLVKAHSRAIRRSSSKIACWCSIR